MTLNQKSILLVLVLFNLVVFGGGFLAVNGLPEQQQRQVGELQKAVERALAFVSPTPVPRSIVAPTPTRPSLPVAVLAPTMAKPTQPPASRRVLPAPTAVPPPPQPPVVQGGTGPSNPLMPGDTWQTLGARGIVWYKVGNGGDHIDALLQANLIDGMKMEVFTPDNLERPIGLGTYNRGLNGLAWAGGHWSSLGAWVARVTNGNPSPVQYRVLSATYVIGHCDSTSYWELINGNPAYWTRCK